MRYKGQRCDDSALNFIIVDPYKNFSYKVRSVSSKLSATGCCLEQEKNITLSLKQKSPYASAPTTGSLPN